MRGDDGALKKEEYVTVASVFIWQCARIAIIDTRFSPMIIAKSWSVVQLEFQGNILVRLSFQLSASNTYIHTYMCRVLYNKKSKRSSRLG